MKTAEEWLKQSYNDQFTHANIKHLAEMCDDYFKYAHQHQKVEQEEDSGMFMITEDGPEKIEEEEKPTDERSILIKFLEFKDNINMAGYAEPEDIVDRYLIKRINK